MKISCGAAAPLGLNVHPPLCKNFLSASECDHVWERMLPSGYQDVVARAVTPIQVIPSRKDLFHRLSTHPLIINQGRRFWFLPVLKSDPVSVLGVDSPGLVRTEPVISVCGHGSGSPTDMPTSFDRVQSFSIDRLTGKKCFMLSSRDVHIAWGGDARYWSWIALPESRFPQVAELLRVCWLDIRGSIDTSELSPDTHYTVHCILKLRSDSYGFNAPVNLSLSTSNGTRFSSRSVFVGRRRPRGGRWSNLRPRNGGDQWMEVELGEFHTGEQGEVEFRLTETEMLHWKHGLVLEGFEIKPKQMNAQP